MRHSEDTKDIILPSQYLLWRRLTKGSDLRLRTTPESLTNYLVTKNVLELLTVKTKENVRCKILRDPTEALEQLQVDSWQWHFQLSRRQVASPWATMRRAMSSIMGFRAFTKCKTSALVLHLGRRTDSQPRSSNTSPPKTTTPIKRSGGNA